MYRYPFLSSLFSWVITLSIVLTTWAVPAVTADLPSVVGQAASPLNGDLATALSATTPIDGGKIHPVLIQLADEAPDETVRVIVQKSGQSDLAEQAIAKVDGEILAKLSIINAFAAEIPAANIPQLSNETAIRWVTLDAPVMRSGEPPLGGEGVPFFDSFSANVYDGNDGTSQWSEEWSELGEIDGPDLGNVVITRFLGGDHQGLRIQNGAQGAQRFFSLPENGSATLSFDYRRKGLATASHYVQVEVSRDDGVSWQEIGRLEGPATDEDLLNASFDISKFASATTGIRFVSSVSMREDSKIYIDNVSVNVQEAVARPTESAYSIFLPQIAGAESTNTESVQDPISVTSRRMVTDSRPQALDSFRSRSYVGSDGSLDWKNGWTELGENDGPTSGVLQVRGSRRCASGYCLRLGSRSSNDVTFEEIAVAREVDLSGASSAELSYSYWRRGNSDGTPTVSTEVSADGGRTWVKLRGYVLNSSDSGSTTEVFDISDFLSSNTQVRFALSGTLRAWQSSFILIDDVKIAYEENDSVPEDPLPDPDQTLVTATVEDSFNQIDYRNNDGSSHWAGSWLEVNDDGTPYRGDVGIAWNELILRNNNRRIQRSVNLDGSTLATLSFSYRRSGFDSADDYVSVEVSPDGGSTWEEVHRISGAGSDWNNQKVTTDVTAYATADTAFRWSTSPTLGRWDQFFVDDVVIEHDCAQCIDKSRLASEHVLALEAPELWNGAGFVQGQNVTVAVVDSGIAEHPDLMDRDGNSRILARMDFTQENGTSDDFYGHGTHVAGTIGGNGRRSKGSFMGMAPKANFVDVRVIDDYGAGSTMSVLTGLEWILDNKDAYNIKVANLSLNSSVAESYHVSPLNAALEILWFNGITVVVSAGNNGDDGHLYPPANDPFLITVGATSTNGSRFVDDHEIASFSARGQIENGVYKPELVVPGKAIVAALASDDSNIVNDHRDHIVPGENGNHYFRMSGTSAASAVAAGAVALLINDEPELTPDQIKFRLMATAKSKKGDNYLRIVPAVRGTTTNMANIGTEVSRLLFTGIYPTELDDSIWPEVNWASASVNWASVNWASVNLNASVNWASVNWDPENLEAADEFDDSGD